MIFSLLELILRMLFLPINYFDRQLSVVIKRCQYHCRFRSSTSFSCVSLYRSFRLNTCIGSWRWIALLFLMARGVNGQISYSEVKSGTCGTFGRVDITDKATCETAAGNLLV